jgi:hypothetical protein
MAEHIHYRSDQSDLNSENTRRPRRYAFGRTANIDEGDSVPLFLSDPDGEPDPEEYSNGLQPQRRLSLSFKLLMTAAAAACVAMLLAWFSSDATRDVMISAKASIATVLPIPSTAAQAEASQPAPAGRLTTADLQLTSPAQASAAPSPQLASAPPSREDISSAYQNALHSRPSVAAPAAVPPQVVAPVAVVPSPVAPQARRMDPDELATLMKRAKESLATGDIPVARLLLERAADGQDAGAALTLAQTYDPAVLGTSDVRNIAPEPDKAKSWYQRAARLGSADAQRRMAQMQN